MYLIKNVTTSYEFPNTTSYDVDEQPNIIKETQFANGKRKKITTTYTDCVINFNIHGLSLSEANTLKANMVDGDTYEYLYIDGTYHTAKFIFTIPTFSVAQALSTSNGIIDELTIKMEKSDDV